jgi:hypothetical protein
MFFEFLRLCLATQKIAFKQLFFENFQNVVATLRGLILFGSRSVVSNSFVCRFLTFCLSLNVDKVLKFCNDLEDFVDTMSRLSLPNCISSSEIRELGYAFMNLPLFVGGAAQQAAKQPLMYDNRRSDSSASASTSTKSFYEQNAELIARDGSKLDQRPLNDIFVDENRLLSGGAERTLSFQIREPVAKQLQPDLSALKHETAQRLVSFDAVAVAAAAAAAAAANASPTSVDSFKQPSQLKLALFDEKQVERAAREWKSQLDDAATRTLSVAGSVGGKVIEAAPVSVDERTATSSGELDRARVFLNRVGAALRAKPVTFDAFLATMDEYLRDRNNTIDESAAKLLAMLQSSAPDLVPDLLQWLPKSTRARLQSSLLNSGNKGGGTSSNAAASTSAPLARDADAETLAARLARFTGEQFQLTSSIDAAAGNDLMQLLAVPLARSAAGADAFPFDTNNIGGSGSGANEIPVRVSEIYIVAHRVKTNNEKVCKYVGGVRWRGERRRRAIRHAESPARARAADEPDLARHRAVGRRRQSVVAATTTAPATTAADAVATTAIANATTIAVSAAATAATATTDAADDGARWRAGADAGGNVVRPRHRSALPRDHAGLCKRRHRSQAGARSLWRAVWRHARRAERGRHHARRTADAPRSRHCLRLNLLSYCSIRFKRNGNNAIHKRIRARIHNEQMS